MVAIAEEGQRAGSAGTNEDPEFDMKMDSLLNEAVFKDNRWDQAIAHLKKHGLLDKGHALTLMKKGRHAFGFWEAESLDTSLGHLMGVPSEPSPAVAALVETLKEKPKTSCPLEGETERVDSMFMGGVSSKMSLVRLVKWLSKVSKDADQLESSRKSTWDSALGASVLRKLKNVLLIVSAVSSLVYGIVFVTDLYSNVPRILGWQVVISRATAMALGILSAFLYLSMSRSFLTRLSGSYMASKLYYFGAMCDAHKELHMYAGMLSVVYAAIHTLGHLIGTAPGIITHTVEELNAVFGCANPSEKPGYVAVDLGFLVFPKCPLTENHFTYLGVLFQTTPGVSGLLLWAVLGLMAWTGRDKQRKKNYERFYWIHNFGIAMWPFLLFWHGAIGLVGFGIPFANFFLSLPLLIFIYDRIRWRFRRYILRQKDELVDAVVRIKPGTNVGSMVKLQFDSPRIKYRHHAGMYAFMCFPEFSGLQWHPFTVCSSEMEPTVDFLIADAGDWTQALLKACVEARDGKRDLPMLQLDGPYSAPTQHFCDSKVLVAIGAGVGITPFLAMLSAMIGRLHLERERSKVGGVTTHAHLIWMTRNSDEFAFGKSHIREIMQDPYIRQRVVLHLHFTGRTPANNAAGYLFREAVKRQSGVDRAALKKALDGDLMRALPSYRTRSSRDLAWHQMPWSWLVGLEQDAIWLDFESKAVPHGGTGVITPSIVGQESSASPTLLVKPEEMTVPMIFGRPDLSRLISSIGQYFRDEDIDVYVCGNDTIVNALRTAVKDCNNAAQEAAENHGQRQQFFTLRFEHFG